MSHFTTVASFLLLSVGLSAASTICVPGDQPTIQAGINSAAEGDTVLVAEGTYFERIAFRGVDIVVLGEAGAERTTIDGKAQGTVVTFETGETTATVLAGFTIRNGNDFSGGGIYCSSSAPTITNCTISENSADYGGGLYCYISDPTITNCILWGDHPEEITLNGSSPTLTYCNIEGDYPGEGNIDANPRFRSVRGFDYVLCPGSPCIDAGTGDDDSIDWSALNSSYGKFNSAAPDMGAYGGPCAAGWLK